MSAPVRFPNVNALWGTLVAEVLRRLGLTHAVISPGSRSTPLVWGLTRTPGISCVPILDERSAAFFALGLARRTGSPVALVCTSGTAAANYLPALIEASMAGTPLLVLTADRPAEMRDCASGQTIDQVKLFGHYPRWQAELPLPQADEPMLRCLRQTLVHAWERTLWPTPGPVHLNVPLRDPLAPTEHNPLAFEEAAWQALLAPVAAPEPAAFRPVFTVLPDAVLKLLLRPRGLIVAGPAQTSDPDAYAEAVGALSRATGWPVLGEALGPLRHRRSQVSGLVAHYDLILRREAHARGLRPEAVLSLGAPPTSKTLRAWLEKQRVPTLVLAASPDNVDPLHRDAMPVRAAIEPFSKAVVAAGLRESVDARAFREAWLNADAGAANYLSDALGERAELFEGKLHRLLPRLLPPDTPVVIANSMPVRDAEYFTPAQDSRLRPFFSRGANGIDGTLSTALGVAHGGDPTVLVTGDLAFLHDSNGLLSAHKFEGSLTVVVINNEGGGIFENLPVAAFNPPFEEFFATPQRVSIEGLARAHGVDYARPESWDALKELLRSLPEKGVRVVELKTDRKRDTALRREIFQAYAGT